MSPADLKFYGLMWLMVAAVFGIWRLLTLKEEETLGQSLLRIVLTVTFYLLGFIGLIRFVKWVWTG